jgi:hypothetical protein
MGRAYMWAYAADGSLHVSYDWQLLVLGSCSGKLCGIRSYEIEATVIFIQALLSADSPGLTAVPAL